MTASLTPALALAYLQELSVDVRAAVVLDAAGRPLAGDADLAPRARDLLASTAATHAADGPLVVARASDGGAIAAIAGDFALMPLFESDVTAIVEALVTAHSDPPGTSDFPY